MPYGVTPQGFNRPRVPEILAEIEERARAIWGAGVIQTAQTELGQLNGMFAELVGTLWESAENVYQSYDPDQAEGICLEQLGRMRLLERIEGELDPAFRQAITNAGRARLDIADIERAAASVTGVSWCKAYAAGRCSPIQGLPARSVAVAALGGADADIAAAVHGFVAPGIDLYGNAPVELVVDGYCRSYPIVRPALLRIGLNLSVRFQPDQQGCPPPSALAVAETVANGFAGAGRPVNGQDVTLHLLRTIVAAAYPNVEIVSGTATLLPNGMPAALPYSVLFLEMATVDPDDVTVTVV
ncbi:MAG: hypothetical protein K2X54_16050 [Methylobacterium organophilum]|nr:hypothetical protein [Methylobacterium organophilum]